MAAKTKRLRKLLEEESTELEDLSTLEDETIDKDVLSRIVERMQKKYEARGVSAELGEAEGIKEMVEFGPAAMKIEKGRPKDLMLFESPYVRGFAKFYDTLKAPLSFFGNLIDKFFGDRLHTDLIAANMHYSVSQYISLSVAVISVVLVMALFIMSSFVVIFNLDIFAAIFTLLILPFISVGFILLIPSNRAQKMALKIDKELPFALRHMAIEVRAGVGVYKVMESISSAGYGAVSDGFKFVLFSIEKGVPVEEALESWAAKTKSDGLKQAIFHLVRAMRTGGNLSEIMITIAEEVSFERRMRITEYASKLSLMSLFLLMAAIVFPVMFTILTAVGSSPQISGFVPMFAVFSPSFLLILYFAICPALILMFIMLVKSTDPG